jgi:hypothetical protein
MPEFNNEDLILIKYSIGNYHYNLSMKKEKLKETIKKNPDGSIFNKLGNFTKELKDVREKLIQLLKLEKKINTIYQGE